MKILLKVTNIVFLMIGVAVVAVLADIVVVVILICTTYYLQPLNNF